MRRRVFALCLCFGLGGCCPDETNVVLVDLQPRSLYGRVLWVGDTITPLAIASAVSPPFCNHENYRSSRFPDRFVYATSDSSIVALGAHGLVIARGAGRTTITSTTASVVGTQIVIVTEPIARLNIAVSPMNPHVGDTLGVQVMALDVNGRVVPNAMLESYELLAPAEQLGAWISSTSTGIARFRTTRSGTWRIVAVAPHAASGPPYARKDTVSVTIAP